MNKPLTVARQEFVDGLVELINSSALPAFIIREVIAKTDVELAKVEQTQYEQEKKAWEESQTEGEECTQK